MTVIGCHPLQSLAGTLPRRGSLHAPRRSAAHHLVRGASSCPAKLATCGPPRRQLTALAAAATGKDAGKDAAAKEAKKSAEYTKEMQSKMGTTLTYNHEAGLNYNRVTPDLICGSCLQTAADLDWLAEKEGVTTIFCLQEDSDMEYFKLDIKPIQEQAKKKGVNHVRFRIRDFDPFDLRQKLPEAVKALAASHTADKGTVYIHCTAGMGRAPAVALAYMTWLRGWQLDDAFAKLREVRMCSPRLEAIRAAAADKLLGMKPVQTTIALTRTGTAQKIQVAGLDVGWNGRLDLTVDKKMGFVLRRELMPGRYVYKFIIDDYWCASMDHPTIGDGNNLNNVLEVISGDMSTEKQQQQMRLLSTGGLLQPDERAALEKILLQA